MTATNHWGIWVNSESPVTGVISNNTIAQFISDEMYSSNGINLDWEEHVAECPNEEHDDCWEDGQQDTWLIGTWKQGNDGKYEPDKEGEYAAIVGEIYTQVVWSKYTQRCALCSPCFPGQGDIDSKGEYLAYTLPPDALDEDQE